MEKAIYVTYELTTKDERVTEDWVHEKVQEYVNLIHELEAFYCIRVEVDEFEY